jgi:acetylornithine aminotransferase
MEQVRSVCGVKEVRGRGLMIGIELDEPADTLRKKLLFDHRVFTGASGKHTIRLLPSLALQKADVDMFLESFEKVINHKALV